MEACCRAVLETGIPCSLEEREAAVLAELARDGEASVAFTGLRRRLNVHQQILTRTLRRLEECGLVAREERGYRLTESGFSILHGRAVARPAGETLSVVQAILPPAVSADDAVARLAGRWFAGLRWYGKSGGPGESVLTWLAEPGDATVRLRINGGAIAVEVESPPGAVETAFAAIRPLLAALAELYAVPRRATPRPEPAGPRVAA